MSIQAQNDLIIGIASSNLYEGCRKNGISKEVVSDVLKGMIEYPVCNTKCWLNKKLRI